MTSAQSVSPRPPELASKPAEMALLGSLILREEARRSAIEEVSAVVTQADFFLPQHRTIYKTLLSMKGNGQAIDTVLLRDELSNQGELIRIGGPEYLMALSVDLPHGENALEYAREVRNFASRRRALTLIGRIGTDLKANRPATGALAKLEEEIAALEGIRPKGETNGGAPVLLRLSDVSPSTVQWLWPGRIPLGKLILLDGDPSLGKTLIALDVAARVSTGREMPDGAHADCSGPGGVVMLSAEDDPEDTLRPRLDAAGGDPQRVVLLTGITRPSKGKDDATCSPEAKDRIPNLSDINALRQAIEQVEARLVIIDPFMAYLGGADSHVDGDIRSLLAPLSQLASDTGAAILLIRHLNKSAGGSPIYRGGGSIGIIAAARAGLVVGADPDDESGTRRILAVTKSNLSEKAPSLAYSVVAPEGMARIEWHGETNHTAATILQIGGSDEERSAVEEAEVFLRELLTAGPRPAKEIKKEVADAGISWRSVERAKEKLSIQSKRVGFSGPWSWALPADGGWRGVEVRHTPPSPNGGLGGLRQNSEKHASNGGFTIDRQVEPLAVYASRTEVPLNGSKGQKEPKAANPTKTANATGQGGGPEGDYERREREAIEGEGSTS